MAENRTTILKIELDVKQYGIAAKEASDNLIVLKARQEDLKASGGTLTVEYAKLKEEIKQQTKVLNDSAAAIVINDKLNKGQTGSVNDLRAAQKLLTTQYNALTKEERENSEAGKALTKNLADVSEAISVAGDKVNDGRTRVGQYEQAIRKALSGVSDLKKEQTQIGYALDQNKKKLDDASDSLNALTQAGDTTSAEYQSLSSEVEFYTDALITNEQTLQQVNQELEEQTSQLQKTEREAAKVGFVYGNNETAAASLKTQLKQLKAELATLDPNSEAFIEGTQRAGELADKIKDVNEAVSATATGSVAEKASNQARSIGEDLQNLDFEGVTEKTAALQATLSNVSFKSLLGGLKSAGKAAIGFAKTLLTPPIIFFAAIIGGIAAAYYILEGRTRDVGAENEKLNVTYENQVRALELLSNAQSKISDLAVREAKLRGASDKEIFQLQLKQFDNERNLRLRGQKENDKSILDKQKLLREALRQNDKDNVTSITKEIKDLRDKNDEIGFQEITFFAERNLLQDEFQKEQSEKLKDAAKDQLQKRKDANQKLIDEAKDAADKIREATLGNIELSNDNERAALEARLDFLTNANELEVQSATDKAQGILEIEQERASKEEELDKAEQASKIARIKADAEEELSEIKGTEEQRAQQRTLLNKKTEEKLEAVGIEFKSRAEDRRKAVADAAVNVAKSVSDAEIKAKEDTEKALDQIDKDKISSLNAELLARENELIKAGATEVEIAQETADLRIAINNEANRQIQEDNEKTDAEKAESAQKTENENLKIKAESKEAQKGYQQELADFINNQITQSVLGGAVQLSEQLLEIKQRELNTQIEGLTKQSEQELSILQSRLEAGLITEEKFNQEKKKIDERTTAEAAKLKQELFKKEKQQKLVGAGINLAAAVIQALAGAPPPVNFILAGITAGLGAVQIASIANAPVPAFAESGRALSGKKIVNGDGLPISRANGDNIFATVRSGEVILNESHQALLGGDDTFRSIGVPGFAGGGSTSALAVSQISNPIDRQSDQQQAFFNFVSNLPQPVVIVQDIAEGLNNKASLEQSANIFT